VIFKQPGTKYYWVKFYFKGKLIRRSTESIDKKTARTIEARIRSELAMGNFGILQPKEVSTLREFLKNSFDPYTQARFKDVPKTLTYYQFGSKRLKSSALGKLHLDEITGQHAVQFIHHYESYSASTINCGLRTLRRALKLAEEWGELGRAPKISLAKGERQRERVLSKEEARIYLMACAQPWRDVASMMYCLGLRPSEIYTLRWEQIALTNEGFIQIVRGKSSAARRMLPLVPEIKIILEARHREQGYPKEGWVFPSTSKSGHLEQGSAKNQHLKAIRVVNDSAKEKARKTGLPDPEETLKPFAPYTLRHTALTNLASQCDTFALKTIAGHSSITITQRYVHPQAKAITEAFEKMEKLHRVVIAGGHRSKRKKVVGIQERLAGATKCKELAGEPPRNRTANLLIKSQLLCRLS
jgi:integrase